MNKHSPVIFLVLILIVSQVKAQLQPADFNLEGHIEEFFGFQDQDVDYEEIYESFMNNFLNPVSLNSARADDLRGLMLLSEVQIGNIIEFRNKYGSFVTVRELHAVPTLDEKTIKAITPFVRVSNVEYEFHNKGLSKTELLIRYTSVLEKKRGYEPSRDSSGAPAYAGSPGRVFTRFYTYKPGSYGISLLAEKDPGENVAWDTENQKYGFDFYSFNITLENKGNLKKLVVGDYQIEAGEQLILGSGLFFGKGAETINTVKRSNRGIRPYRSVLEHSFMRGLAATYEFTDLNLQVTPFFSMRHHSASSDIIINDSTEQPFVTNLRTSGLHRTDSELDGRELQKETTYGTNIDYYNSMANLNIGGTYMYSQFDLPFQPVDQPFRKFAFRGKENFNASLYFNYLHKNMYFFAESAISQSLGKAITAGMISRINDQWQTSLVYRNYDRNFHTSYGTGFSESGSNNERGIYWGLKWQYSSKLQATAFVDIFRFPWLKFQVDAPSQGVESLIRINYKLSPEFKFFTQYRHKAKGRNDNNSGNLPRVAQAQRDNFILHFDMLPQQWFNLKTRISWSTYSFNNRTNGIAIAQDANLYFNRFRLYSRMAFFNTDDFNTRQYIYENDVLYAFSIPALQGKGIRYYLMGRYDLTEDVSLWIKYSRTRYTDREFLGTGNEQINGNKRSEVRFQLRYSF